MTTTNNRSEPSEGTRWRVNIKAVGFDLDGTLLNTLRAMEATYNSVVAPIIGRRISSEEIVSNLGPRAVDIMRIYDPANAEALNDAVVEHYLTIHQSHAYLYPGIAELIAGLVDRVLTRRGDINGKQDRHPITRTLRAHGTLRRRRNRG